MHSRIHRVMLVVVVVCVFGILDSVAKALGLAQTRLVVLKKGSK